jgi:phage shock protein E
VRLLVLVAAASLGACAAPNISGEAARELVQKQGALLLDVRTPAEFAAGHVDGALNVPVQELETALASLPATKDQAIVVYCRSGARSARASGLLKQAGFTRVHDLGGMANWR